LQSKILRARERVENEVREAGEKARRPEVLEKGWKLKVHKRWESRICVCFGRVNSGRYGICYSFFYDLLVFTFVFLIAPSSDRWGNVEMIDSKLSTLPCVIYFVCWFRAAKAGQIRTPPAALIP